MGARGALIMGFFGAVFAAMTMAFRFDATALELGFPFLLFGAIAVAALMILRRPGSGFMVPEKAGRIIMWSSIGEGIGLFVAANLVINLGRPDLLLPAMSLVVGLHFLPMAWAIPFRPFYLLGCSLLLAAGVGFASGHAAVSGFAAAAALWVAAVLAIRREARAKAV